jgi:acetyl esterase
MAIDPDARLVLDMIAAAKRPAFETLTPEEARGFYSAGRTVLQPEPEEVATVRNLTAPGPNGPVPLRLYRASGTELTEKLPVLIYYHGGGWVLGDLDSHDQVCRRFANLTGACVVSVDYRLAPEHRFPAAVADSAAATRWIINNAAALGVDPARVAVGGDSAGGNLAAVMAIMARDMYLPPIGFQLLIYPATDMAMQTGSVQRVTTGFPLTAATMKWFVDLYLSSPAEVMDWRASPIRAVDLSGTAPAFVLTCTHDPLCDEGIAYARRLEQEGVRVTHLHIGDQMHGFLTMGRLIRASDTALLVMSAALRAAWSGRPAG